MQPISSEELNELQGKCRLYLLLSVIFFMISLFSLVSRWTIAFPTIVFSCAFSLLTSRLNKRRYAEALTQRLTVCIAQQAGAEFSAYTASEALDPNRTAMGFTPDTFYVPGAKAHHVFHGMLNGKPLSISEAAFLRKNNSGQTCSVAGTLVSVQNAIPASEAWVILRNNPFSRFCPKDEYAQNGFTPVSSSENLAAWRAPSGTDALLSSCISLLTSNANDCPIALAAQNGTLSLFEIGTFYAPTKVDYTKLFSDSDLKNAQIHTFTLIRQIVEKLSS